MPAGAPPAGYGPHSVGAANQNPDVTSPPDGVSEPDALVEHSGAGPGVWLDRSGSPATGWKSNIAGKLEVWATLMLDVSDGTNQAGNPSVIGSEMGFVAPNGARVSDVVPFNRGSTK